MMGGLRWRLQSLLEKAGRRNWRPLLGEGAEGLSCPQLCILPLAFSPGHVARRV